MELLLGQVQLLPGVIAALQTKVTAGLKSFILYSKRTNCSSPLSELLAKKKKKEKKTIEDYALFAK